MENRQGCDNSKMLWPRYKLLPAFDCSDK